MSVKPEIWRDSFWFQEHTATWRARQIVFRWLERAPDCPLKVISGKRVREGRVVKSLRWKFADNKVEVRVDRSLSDSIQHEGGPVRKLKKCSLQRNLRPSVISSCAERNKPLHLAWSHFITTDECKTSGRMSRSVWKKKEFFVSIKLSLCSSLRCLTAWACSMLVFIKFVQPIDPTLCKN